MRVEVQSAPAVTAERAPAARRRVWPHFRVTTIEPVEISRSVLIAGMKAAIAPFLVSRLLVWAATIFGARYITPPAGMYSNTYPPPALSAFFHWDTDAYAYIAHHGYALGPGGALAQAERLAWFPFYPLLVRLAGGSDWAMFIIPNVAFFAALALLYALATVRMDSQRAGLALWLVALGPAAMFFTYPYTESVFLLATVGAFLLMETGHWLLAAVAGAAAAATRFPGIVVAAALGVEGVARNRRRTLLAASVVAFLGLIAVSVLQWVQAGDPLGFVHARAYWIGPDRNPLYLVGSFPKAVIEGDPFNPEAIGVPVFVIFAVAAVWVTLRMPVAYGVFALGQIVLAADQGLYLHIFSLVPRVVSVIFPCYFAFATFLLPRRNLQLAWLLISGGAMVFLSMMYGAWRFVG